MPAKGRSSTKASRATKGSKYAATKWNSEYTCDLEVPSGQLCLVKRPGMKGLIKAGVWDELNVLSTLVQTEHVDRVQPSAAGEKRRAEIDPAALRGLLEDPHKLASALDLVDRTVCYVVVEPSIVLDPVPDPETGETPERDPDAIYASYVDMKDKMFIFNFVLGGTEDLATFREGSEKVVGDMESEQGVAPAAE